ncbi:hypothetical protein [Cardinium endosymbiont of Nabis limbatus]|uniref:hypothetical protein n=1 Tax=Cardinium endosymbiont of Nabis limbatus TaxID=3066217 RepID=UPI003AF3A390
MRIVLSLLFIFCLPASVTAIEKSSSMATQLAEHYLKSFTEAVVPLPKVHEIKKSKIPDITIFDIHLSLKGERSAVFNEIFAKSNYYQQQYNKVGNVLNKYAWSDLHLFCGTATTPAYHFLSRINKTVTVLGEGAFASLLAAPVANLEALTRRQRLISFLCKNTQLYNNLRGELQNYKASERAMLSFWTEIDPLYAEEYNKYLTKLFYTPSAALNKRARTLQKRKVLVRDIWDIYSNYMWYPVVLGLPITELAYQMGSKLSRGAFYRNRYWMYLPIYNLYYLTKTIRDMKPRPDASLIFLEYIQPSIVTIYSFWQYYKAYHNYKEYAGVLSNLALRMADLQTFLITLKKINALVQQNPALEALYGSQLGPIRLLLARAHEPSEVGNCVI